MGNEINVEVITKDYLNCMAVDTKVTGPSVIYRSTIRNIKKESNSIVLTKANSRVVIKKGDIHKLEINCKDVIINGNRDYTIRFPMEFYAIHWYKLFQGLK